jgi:hypothetical protein
VLEESAEHDASAMFAGMSQLEPENNNNVGSGAGEGGNSLVGGGIGAV